MEDSATILCQISSYKDMLDQVNEEIEMELEKTREIESAIVKCSEMEKGYLMRESELTNMTFLGELELNGLSQIALSTKKSLELLETQLELLKQKSKKLKNEISLKRENFIEEGINFQRNIGTRENKELSELLLERENLETNKSNLNMKINALETSTAAFIEDMLGELQKSVLALNVEIECRNSENMHLLKDIDELKVLLQSLNDSEAFAGN